MDTLNNQIIIDDHVIHPQSHASNIIYGNTTAKNMMDNVLSSANLSQAVQSLLNCNNYTEACRALKTMPETYFDECFNIWNGTNSPQVSNGSLILSANNQTIVTSTTLPLSGDFSVQVEFTTGSSISTQQFVFCNYVSSTIFMALQINTAGNFLPIARISSSSTKSFNTTAASTNTKYFYEMDYDSNTKTWYHFLNGTLFDSQVYSYPGGNHYMRIGGQYQGSNALVGSVQEYRLSDCVRHTSNHTANDSNYFTLDDNTLSLMHFD